KHFFDHPLFRATIQLHENLRPTDPNTRHTNCCVTYSSGLAEGGKRDMILIAFNHRGIGVPGAIGAGLFNAFSRGTLKLASPDPSIDPIVDENMLADPRDIARMRDAVKRLAVITQQPALQGIADWIRSEERRVGKECRSRVGGLPGKDNGQKRIADQQARNWTHV